MVNILEFNPNSEPIYPAVDVMNLATQEIVTYSGVNPSLACVLAYLQSTLHDYNTWQYGPIKVEGQVIEIQSSGNTYQTRILDGAVTVTIGDWCAFKDGRPIR